MNYEVTIGIPVYRAAGYIEHTMESALNQTFPFIEYLVIDDCGDDGSMDIVKQFVDNHPRGRHIRVLKHDHNCGIGMARNRLLSEARGKYIFFLDSDDLIEIDAIENMVSYAHEYGFEVIYGSWERVDDVNHSSSQKSIYPYRELMRPDELAHYVFENYSTFRISVCNCLMLISFLRSSQMRFIDSFYWEDLAFTYEMATKVSKALLLPNITYHYICRPNSLSHYQDRDQLQKDEILSNVDTINYLKGKCNQLINKSYLPFLCSNLEKNSFYIVCHILGNYKRISPHVTTCELHQILYHPLCLSEIIKFRNKKIENLLFWFLGVMPIIIVIPIVFLWGKLKKII